MTEFISRAVSDALLVLGTTPQRREFEYPRVLSKTSPHDKIVEEFRKKYIEQEAVETALPCDSDSDEDMVHCHCVQIADYEEAVTWHAVFKLYVCELCVSIMLLCCYMNFSL